MADFKQTQRAFAAHIRDPEKNPMPEGIEDRRMNIYRDLFINSISGLLSNSFPVIRSLYPTEEAWQTFVRTFFKKEHNKTPHFPEIPREFVDFLKHHSPEGQNRFWENWHIMNGWNCTWKNTTLNFPTILKLKFNQIYYSLKYR